jgi:hypothetical protein
MSSHTGYALFVKNEPVDYGLVEVPIENFKSDIKAYSDLPEDYPFNLIRSARKMVDELFKYYDELGEKIPIIIEHTEAGKYRISQKYLEILHSLFLLEAEKREVKICYMLNSDWRKQVKCYIKDHPEVKKWNSKVSRAKKKATPTKTGRKLAKIDGKVVRKLDQKDLSIKIANDFYGLDLKDDNIADAINLGRACCELGIFG